LRGTNEKDALGRRAAKALFQPLVLVVVLPHIYWFGPNVDRNPILVWALAPCLSDSHLAFLAPVNLHDSKLYWEIHKRLRAVSTIIA
jgi:hypothetical protein